MNELTRPFLPQGIIVGDLTGDDGQLNPPRLNVAEPIIFKPFEICVGYWRPRKWLVSGRVEVGSRSFISAEFDFQIEVTACNKRLGNFDFKFGVEVPAESTPLTELDLTRTYGTKHEGSFQTIVRMRSELPPPDGPFDFTFEGDGNYSIELFTQVIRQFPRNGNQVDWNRIMAASEFTSFAKVDIYPGAGFGGDLTWSAHLGAGEPNGVSGFQAKWLCAGFSKKLWCTGVLDSISGGGSSGQDIVELQPVTLKASEYWPYADRMGQGAKFDTGTGQPLSITSTPIL